MDLRHRYYPYPVLSDDTNDYLDSTFNVTINVGRDGHDIRLDFDVELDNDELNVLLDKGEVIIVYHLECSKTGYRKAIKTTEKQLKYLIPRTKLNGRLQICPFIVAAKNFKGYVNSDLHLDFRGLKFAIDAGCIMAVGCQTISDIEKSTDDLANTSSIFALIKDVDEKARGMLVDMSQNKIVIRIPQETHRKMKILNQTLALRSTINSLVIVPALIYVLEELKNTPVDERYYSSSNSWYRSIKKALKKHFDCDLESDAYTELNHLSIAQKLIDSPFDEAVSTLFGDYKDDSDDEED
jgi:hypothetical protein